MLFLYSVRSLNQPIVNRVLVAMDWDTQHFKEKYSSLNVAK